MKKILIIAALLVSSSLFAAESSGWLEAPYKHILQKTQELITEHLATRNYNAANKLLQEITTLYNGRPLEHQQSLTTKIYGEYKWYLSLHKYDRWPDYKLISYPAELTVSDVYIHYKNNEDKECDLLECQQASSVRWNGHECELPCSLYWPKKAYWLYKNVFAVQASKKSCTPDAKQLYIFQIHKATPKPTIQCILYDQELTVHPNPTNSHNAYVTTVGGDFDLDALRETPPSLPEMLQQIIAKHRTLFEVSSPWWKAWLRPHFARNACVFFVGLWLTYMAKQTYTTLSS